MHLKLALYSCSRPVQACTSLSMEACPTNDFQHACACVASPLVHPPHLLEAAGSMGLRKVGWLHELKTVLTKLHPVHSLFASSKSCAVCVSDIRYLGVEPRHWLLKVCVCL
jgi:hypothetical protein